MTLVHLQNLTTNLHKINSYQRTVWHKPASSHRWGVFWWVGEGEKVWRRAEEEGRRPEHPRIVHCPLPRPWRTRTLHWQIYKHITHIWYNININRVLLGTGEECTGTWSYFSRRSKHCKGSITIINFIIVYAKILLSSNVKCLSRPI